MYVYTDFSNLLRPCELLKILLLDRCIYKMKLIISDAAMAVATYQFSDCPVVHVYTAYTEEDKALQRRKSQKTQHMSIKNKIDGQPSNSDTEVELQPHQISQSQADNMTVLRNEMIVLTFRSILLATKEQRSVLSPFNRTEVILAQGREPLQVGLLNSHDIFGGIVMVLNTELGPLIVELIPSQGNWYLTRMIFMNNTHYPRDLYFYGFEFSLCCTDITVYSSEASRLSFFDFHLDILWQGM